MDIDNIKSWLEECISFLECSPPDIDQERICENRKVCGVPYRKRLEIKAWVLANKPAAIPYLIQLNTWMVDFYHYFDEGYVTVSGETIDTLPKLIKDRLIFIREKIEEL